MPAAQSQDVSTKRLLLVEDDADIAISLCQLLVHPRVIIDVATNGVAAVARARELKPSAILLDVWLPVMDGFEVFRILRREPELADTRIIIMSAYAETGALALAQDLGAYAWLKKPFSPNVLRKRVYGALELEQDHEPREPRDPREPNP